MTDTVTNAALRARVNGQARTGFVTVRDFDQGVIETLGAKVINDHYYITELKSHDSPADLPGIPVVFANPEEVFQSHRLPMISVRRDDISAAMNRWEPGTKHYRVPAPQALPMSSSRVPTQMGFTAYEEYLQSCPYDFLYTINILARERSFMAAANSILRYVMRIYKPYCAVFVTDSIGDQRSYDAFTDSVQPMDEAVEVAERVIGFAMSLRVEGELDIEDPIVHPAVHSATIRYQRR
jgi:hypothetical protein